MERDFPDGFLWSTSTAAHQVEGGNVNDYLDSHLAAVRAAMLEGVDVRGYTYWSAFDNFELAEGYRPLFGLVGIDRAHGLARQVRPSAHAYARVARTGRLAALRETD